MNRDKQIEEMREDLIEIFDEEYDKRRIITADFTAIGLAKKGYRKASDVALKTAYDFQNRLRHIFLNMCEFNDYNTLNLLQIDNAIEALYDTFIAELKKKYTEGEG